MRRLQGRLILVSHVVAVSVPLPPLQRSVPAPGELIIGFIAIKLIGAGRTLDLIRAIT
jgi:hypothetical protein